MNIFNYKATFIDLSLQYINKMFLVISLVPLIYSSSALDNKLDEVIHTDALRRKEQGQLNILRRLKTFNVCRSIIII